MSGHPNILLDLIDRGAADLKPDPMKVVPEARATLRVLVLTPSVQNPGGIQRYSRTLTRALQEILGCSNVVTIAAQEPRVDARTRRTKLAVAAKLQLGWQAISEAVHWRPDLIICTHLSFGPAAWMARILTERPYWIVVHGIEAWCDLPYWKRIALAHADRILVTSAFSREQVASRHQIGSELMWTLPCTLDETLLSVEPSKSGLCQSLGDGRRVILTVARMDSSEGYKGHDVVLQALPSVLAKVPDLVYVVVGGGDDRSRLESLARDLRVAEHVVFTGEISDSELAALYQRSEIFVLPARTEVGGSNPKGEGFGIVFLEAMAFKKPVIGPDYGAPAELVRDGQNGLLVRADDAASVAEAISKMLLNPDMARAMGKTGGDWVRKRYSYRSFSEQLKEMLARFASDAGSSLVVTADVRSSTRSQNIKRSAGSHVLEIVSLVWLVAINMLYYAQFRGALISLLGRVFKIWR